jgi:hypothetical protein
MKKLFFLLILSLIFIPTNHTQAAELCTGAYDCEANELCCAVGNNTTFCNTAPCPSEEVFCSEHPTDEACQPEEPDPPSSTTSNERACEHQGECTTGQLCCDYGNVSFCNASPCPSLSDKPCLDNEHNTCNDTETCYEHNCIKETNVCYVKGFRITIEKDTLLKYKCIGNFDYQKCKIADGTESSVQKIPTGHELFTKCGASGCDPTVKDGCQVPNFLNITGNGSDGVNILIARIIKYTLGIVGTLTLVIFIYGGLLWMTSAGDQNKVKKGGKAMAFAFIGLFITLTSYLLVDFILKLLGE